MQTIQRVGSWRPTRATPYPPACPRWFRTLAEALFWSEHEWRIEIAASNVSYRLFKTPIAARLELWRLQKGLRFAFAAILVSASVQIGLLPLMVIYFHRLSIASLALNIFVGILMAALAFIALAALVISHLSASLAAPLVNLTEKINWIMIHLVDPFARFNVASMRLPHYAGWLGCIYVVYYVVLGFLIFALAQWNPLGPFWTKATSPLSTRMLRVGGLAFAGLLAMIILHPFSARRPDGKLHVD